jgi:hypothetical protein
MKGVLMFQTVAGFHQANSRPTEQLEEMGYRTKMAL